MFVSNNVIEAAHNLKRNTEVCDVKVGDTVDKTLHFMGVKRSHYSHHLLILVVDLGPNATATKLVKQRTVLSFVSTLFDPNSFLPPYTVSAGVRLKNNCRLGGQQ